MLYQWLRLFHDDDGTLIDRSIDNQDEATTVSLVIDQTDDYLYFAQHYPFNNFFIQMDTVNTNAGSLAIQYWGGQAQGWVDAVDILDATSVAGVPLARSGVVQFSPDIQFSWHIVGDTRTEPQPLGLETLNIYNVFWIRFRWSATPSAGTDMKRLVYSFTRSQQIDNIDVQINQFLTSFAAGKTNWDDEIITASMMLVNDMRRRGIIVHQGQLLRFDDVSLAADWMTLCLIYRNLGPAFLDKLTRSKQEYEMAISVKAFSIDENQSGFLERREVSGKVVGLVR